jgi:molybdopterin synthase catalytic subunit
MTVELAHQTFDPHTALAAFEQRQGDNVGAVSSFIGRMRSDGGLQSMTLEHYPGMTEKEIGRIVREARARWSLADALVIHRTGMVRPGEAIVLVAAAAPHRGEALAAVEFMIDYLKTKAPFWKKEERPGGGAWVEARTADTLAADRWK